MSRLVDVPASLPLPARVRCAVGDVLRLAATGVLPPDPGAVEVLGPFLPGILDDAGDVLGAQGVPGTVLLLARAPGTAVLDLVRSSGLAGPVTRVALAVEVAPS